MTEMDYTRAITIAKQDLALFRIKREDERLINSHCSVLYHEYGFDSDDGESFMKTYCDGKRLSFDSLEDYKAGLAKATDITDVGTLYVSYWRALTHWDMYVIDDTKRAVLIAILERLIQLMEGAAN